MADARVLQLDQAAVAIPEAQQTSAQAEVAKATGAEVAITNLIQRLFHSEDVDAPRVVGFVAAESQAGCTWVCAELARALAAQVKERVLLVDANPRTPGLSHHLSIAEGTIPASSSDGLRKQTYQLPGENLWILGNDGPVPSHSKASSMFERLRAEMPSLREEFRYVLVDMPPLNRYADSIALGPCTHGVVLVVRANHSRRESARNAVALLKAANIRVLGVVLNQRSFSVPERLYGLV